MRRADCMAGEASRVDAGRTTSATSDHGRDGSERRAPIPSCAGGVGSAAREAAPADPKPPAQAGAVILCEQALILLRAVAAYEQVDNAAAVTLALATHCNRIGAGPLARAVLDDFERPAANRHTRESTTVGGEGNPALPAGMLDDGDMHAEPEFRRIGENRYRGGGP